MSGGFVGGLVLVRPVTGYRRGGVLVIKRRRSREASVYKVHPAVGLLELVFHRCAGRQHGEQLFDVEEDREEVGQVVRSVHPVILPIGSGRFRNSVRVDIVVIIGGMPIGVRCGCRV